MADNKAAVLELASLASDAILEVERLQKGASLDPAKLDHVAHTLVNSGMLNSEQHDDFIKVASNDPSSLLNLIEFMAKKANVKSTVSTGVGTVVKNPGNTPKGSPDPDEPFKVLYGIR